MEQWIISAAITAVILSAVVVLYNHYRTRKTMDTLEAMLDQAIRGCFTEELFDETRLSALETRFAQYLSSSALSSRQTAHEKEQIKTLISDISHQTKTPIANLLLYSELLAEESLSASAKDNVLALHQQTEKLRFLIDALVKLSRLETGIISLSAASQPLQPVLTDAAGQYLAKAREKGLTLHLEPTGATACFDRKWTTEALCNVLDNAVKYTESGSITISVSVYELFVCINVSDTGIGIPPEEYSKIFSRFYRSQQTPEQNGVGIGLYLTQEILSGEGGYIKVSSSPGRGSVFSLYLPVSPPALSSPEK